jgi:EmrB/QacA subfamily drug resistance transporter
VSGFTVSETRVGLVVALGGLVAVLDATIVAVAFPDLMRAFDTGVTGGQWVTTAYTLALVATMPLAAALAGRWGARRIYPAALCTFAGASLWAAAAGNFGSLIAARAGQGLAGGLITTVGMRIAFGAVDPERRARMTAYTGLPLLIGPILGPILGGLLLDVGSWRSLFLVTAAPALAAALGALRWVPKDPAAQERFKTDVISSFLLVPGVVLVTYALSAEGTEAVARLALLGFGGALVAAFVRRSSVHPRPLLQVRLLRDRVFARNAAVLALYAAPYFGSILLMPTYVQVLRSDGALQTALLMIPGAVGMGLTVQVAARVLERLGATAVVGTGLALALLHGVVTVIVLRPDTPYAVLALIGALRGVATGAVMMPTIAAATRRLHGSDLASGSSILPLVSTIANGIGTAAVSALFAGLIAWHLPTGSLSSLERLHGPVRAAAVADAVDALRATQSATLLLIVLALVVRLRGQRRNLTGRAVRAEAGRKR